MLRLADAPCLEHLNVFQLGVEDDSFYAEGQSLTDLVGRMPRLEYLHLYARRLPTHDLFALPFPRLEALLVHSAGDYALDVLAANPTLVRLRELDLWPHTLEHGDDSAYITFKGVRALVHSPNLPALERLQLRLSDLGDRGCEEIVRIGNPQAAEVARRHRGAHDQAPAPARWRPAPT